MDINFNSIYSWGFEIAKEGIKFIEPYQPLIASALIVGKIVYWSAYKQKALTQEIKHFNCEIGRLNGIRRLNEIQRSTVFDASQNIQSRIQTLDRRIQNLKEKRDEKKRQINFSYFVFGQIPSLFFDHPGVNLYQSLHQILNRTLQMRNEGLPLCPEQRTHWNRLKNSVKLVVGLISMAGTGASLGRMVGLIKPDNRTSHILSYMAIGVHTFEGAIMLVNGAKEIKKYLAISENWERIKRWTKVALLPIGASALFYGMQRAKT